MLYIVVIVPPPVCSVPSCLHEDDRESSFLYHQGKVVEHTMNGVGVVYQGGHVLETG